MGTTSDHGLAIMGAVGAALLILCGLAFIVSEFVRFRRRKTPGYTGFISMRSTTRRIVGSLILIVLGLMLHIGLAVINFSHRPVFFSMYWITCSFLAFILSVLGIFDLREVREHRSIHHLRLLWRMAKDMSRKS